MEFRRRALRRPRTNELANQSKQPGPCWGDQDGRSGVVVNASADVRMNFLLMGTVVGCKCATYAADT